MASIPMPIVHYSTARGYVQSAFCIMCSTERLTLPNDTTFFLSFHMLAAFALELYLKAYLLSCDFTEKEMKEAGHNLEKLYGLAVSEGLKAFGVAEMAKALHAHHSTFEYRYMRPDTNFRTASLGAIFQTFTALNRFVDTAVGASASKGLSGDGAWIFPADRPDWRFPVN